MTSAQAKEISDAINNEDIDRADADLDHVMIEISNAAGEDHYSLEYEFIEERQFPLVNEIKNQLLALGYEVEIQQRENQLVIIIDWSSSE